MATGARSWLGHRSQRAGSRRTALGLRARATIAFGVVGLFAATGLAMRRSTSSARGSSPSRPWSSTCSRSRDSTPTSDPLATVAQLVCTLTAQPGVGRVEFSIDGAAIEVPRADGSLTDAAVTRDDYADLLLGAAP